MPESAVTPVERILVCDADARTVRALRVVLRDVGFRVEAAASAEAALDAAALRPAAAAIVELALPDADGVDLCRRLREWSTIPLIVLSAIDDEHHKVRALNAGADDYVTKPFAPRELVARVRATLRRAQGGTRDQRIEVEGGLAVDFARHAVYRDGQEVHLTPIEFRLLGVLLRDRGRLHTHASLLRQVWGPGHVHDAQLLRTHIANLRRKLASPGIRTLHGVGYRFEEAQPCAAAIPGRARRPTRVPDLRAARRVMV
ncbi:MAG TPA: response regulator transcription factor [Solirubrobacteraceae bacterium]|nr:response regulator transcription factor [Solirubrobacteraceae bacterium]